jgi:excisionase family DNA binding protein
MSGMVMRFDADTFTTGHVAKIIGVAARTVNKWVDSGKLQGYRLPGSQDRRVTRDSLLRFLRENGMEHIVEKLEPTPEVPPEPPPSCLLCGLSPHLEESLRGLLPVGTVVRSAPDLFGVGLCLAEAPDVAVLDLSIGRSDEVRRAVGRLLLDCRTVIILLAEDAPAYLPEVFEGAMHLRQPCSAEQVAALLGEGCGS